ncbi:Uncharacterized protein APZ42_002850 [Daphnia magna]|uniref:YCII-related domain-containing protein n=1 Tax=Daphnia magna TaxID=35525 RepID=A0A164HZX4_9CRUS|nr:Uncharacterized protein APZ42_002850 [Daphnia magna]
MSTPNPVPATVLESAPPAASASATPADSSYMLLIVEPLGQRQARGRTGGEQAYARMLAFGADLQARGLLEASNSLASTRQAVRLQVREGQTQLTDGPFAEAKEMIGGFFLLKNCSRALALEMAARCPAAEWATVEVRQVGPCFEDAEPA